MKKNLLALFVILFFNISLRAQSIQWNHLLLPGEINVVAKDSTEKSLIIFRSRLFLYDSLHSISRETGVPFFEYDYIAEFKTAQEVNHLVINFKNASRLMYYIRLYDEQNGMHVVYNYGAIRACDPETQTLILTIAHTPYKVKKVEIGTFKGKDDFLKIGISNESNGNKVVQELVAQRLNSLCNKASYFTDKLALTDAVNSESFEVKPVIAPDGKTLYFHRQNHKDNIGGKKDDQDIYISRFVNNEWTPAENIEAPLNDNLPNGVASVSSGETTLYLINEYEGPNQQKQGLSYSEKTISGWSFPKKIEVKNYYNRSPYMDYFISPTQNEMILAIQRDDSYGDQDLYVSFYEDGTGTWTEPLNLGSEVNSMISEASPFLAADGKTLYFASDGFLGYGGFDIYVTHRLDDSWTNWSFPENLGPVVNTFDDDLYYTVSAAGDQAYFISTVNKDRNVYRIPLPAIYKPEAVVLLSGKIFNQASAMPEEAEIKIRWHGEEEVIGTGKSDPLTGEYKVVLPAGGVYDYTISKNGYVTVSGTINTLKVKNYEEKQRHIRIAKEEQAETRSITMESGNETDLQWKRKVEIAGEFLKAFPEYNATIENGVDDTVKNVPLVRTADGIRQNLINAGALRQQVKMNKGNSGKVLLTLSSDTIVYYNESAAVPEGYVKPDRTEGSDVSLMVKGKVVDATTFKPVGTRMVFKTSNKIKSRSSSDPATGNYQTVLPANTQYEVALYKDTTQYVFKYHTPYATQYKEVDFICLVNKEQVRSAQFEIGSGTSINSEEKSVPRWKQFLNTRKASRDFLNLKKKEEAIAPSIHQDLTYLSDVLRAMPEIKITLITNTSSKIKDQKDTQEAIAQRCVEFLTTQGLKKEQITVKHAGNTMPKHKKGKHASNNRLVAEIVY